MYSNELRSLGALHEKELIEGNWYPLTLKNKKSGKELILFHLSKTRHLFNLSEAQATLLIDIEQSSYDDAAFLTADAAVPALESGEHLKAKAKPRPGGVQLGLFS